MNCDHDTPADDAMTGHEHNTMLAQFRDWLEVESRKRLEDAEFRAWLADAERRLDSLERRLCPLDGPPMPRGWR